MTWGKHITQLWVLVPLLFLAAQNQVHAEGASCSDLSEHQSVLNEGQSFIRGSDGGGILIRGESSFDYIPSDRVFYSPEQGERMFLSNVLSNEQIDKLRTATASDINSAEWYARISERAGRYDNARRIYQRILTAERSNPIAKKCARTQTLKDLERISLAQTAQTLAARFQYTEAAATYKKLIESIDANDYLDVRTKFQLLKKIFGLMTTTFENTPMGWVLSNFPEPKKVVAQAASQLDGYRKSLQCLDLADQLNAVGWKLEQQGIYPKAEKMYREALMIRTKNLGENDPETIAEYGELAHLQAEQKHYPQALALYEQSLTDYRKLPAPGSTYGAMLQSYGDLLSQLKQQKKADAVYEEARAYYRQNAAPLKK